MSPSNALPLTHHARARVDGRRIPAGAVEAVLLRGRTVWAGGARIHALGKKEVKRAFRLGFDLRDLRPYSGLQVVCAPDGDVLTVYRNHDFKALRRAA